MGTSKQQAKDRAARAAQLRAAQERRERRRTLLVMGATLAACVLLVSVVVVVINGERDRQGREQAAADAPIEGVQEFADLPRDHVTEQVQYDQSPPVGGNHEGVWTNCGVYAQPLSNEQSVHSLEHGAVWITYDPALPAAQVETLTALVQPNPFGLQSPFPGLSSPIVASAWGVQLAVDDADDPRLARFIEKYAQGEQTPEPGAPCTGGVTPA
ncbi:DUF3105 domain-containing protein [Thalassiella azotivora]